MLLPVLCAMCSQLTYCWMKMVMFAYQILAWPATSPRRNLMPACKLSRPEIADSSCLYCCILVRCQLLLFSELEMMVSVGACVVQWYPRIHGSGGVSQGNTIRFQCWLVFIWLHALQTAQGVRHGALNCYESSRSKGNTSDFVCNWQLTSEKTTGCVIIHNSCSISTNSILCCFVAIVHSDSTKPKTRWKLIGLLYPWYVCGVLRF